MNQFKGRGFQCSCLFLFTDCSQSIIETKSCQVERSRDLIFRMLGLITSRLKFILSEVEKLEVTVHYD
ncbi:hypothetical protein Murru_3215 [Allomuricauda ruestringensis DSM 13258]|uniref:Uncharacterized protein n=1 Tax=Allomuricauda ruestringensis (strain DSM 13258 / CIP 107369 / LMG 19739 / B1) TaxID=886377 RepID=G2PLW6_ALLRU|nr:hypothetical protein Murru_3215 [Allomuricauda ruestringensis DSM 13258]